MLLTLDDMPPGWSTLVDDQPEDDSPNDAFCPAVENAFIEADGSDPPSAQYTQGQLGPFVLEAISPGGEQAYERLVAAFDSCVGEAWTTTDDDGSETKWSMGELSATDLGERSKAYRMSGTFQGGTASVDIVVGTTDDVAAAVVGLSFTTILGGEPLSPDDFATIVEKASDKLG